MRAAPWMNYDERTPRERLRDLAKHFQEAEARYHAHKLPHDATIDQRIDHDLRDIELRDAATRARVAYETALREFKPDPSP